MSKNIHKTIIATATIGLTGLLLLAVDLNPAVNLTLSGGAIAAILTIIIIAVSMNAAIHFQHINHKTDLHHKNLDTTLNEDSKSTLT